MSGANVLGLEALEFLLVAEFVGLYMDPVRWFSSFNGNVNIPCCLVLLKKKVDGVYKIAKPQRTGLSSMDAPAEARQTLTE